MCDPFLYVPSTVIVPEICFTPALPHPLLNVWLCADTLAAKKISSNKEIIVCARVTGGEKERRQTALPVCPSICCERQSVRAQGKT
jgi:hypothetical protein